MTDTEINENRPKKKKRRNRFGLVYLFLFVFIAALAAMSYLVKEYSPEIDVSLGDKESLTLGSSETDVEIKAIDDRLKWIQMEDELPSVALRDIEKRAEKLKEKEEAEELEKLKKQEEQKEKDKEDKKTEKETVEKREAPVPTIEDIKKEHSDFREIPAATPVIPAPTPAVTKVYLGSYPDIETAMEVQNKVNSTDPSIASFVKAVNGKYIVQLGSFSDKNRAKALVTQLQEKGFSPKLNYEN